MPSVLGEKLPQAESVTGSELSFTSGHNEIISFWDTTTDTHKYKVQADV